MVFNSSLVFLVTMAPGGRASHSDWHVPRPQAEASLKQNLQAAVGDLAGSTQHIGHPGPEEKSYPRLIAILLRTQRLNSGNLITVQQVPKES